MNPVTSSGYEEWRKENVEEIATDCGLMSREEIYNFLVPIKLDETKN